MAEVLALRALDTDRDPEFDGIVNAAAAVCGVPVVLLSLIDDQRQWYKATVGFDLPEVPRDDAICAHTIAQPEGPLILPDARQHPNFSLNPFVNQEGGVRFYAGWPLVSSSGKAVGSLCIVDSEPREGLSEAQFIAMTGLAATAARLFEGNRYRIELSEAMEQQEKDYATLLERAAALSHEAATVNQAVSEVLDSMVAVLGAESAQYWVRTRRGLRQSRLWAGDAYTVLHHREHRRSVSSPPVVVNLASFTGRAVISRDERGFDVFAIPIPDRAGAAGVISLHLGRTVEPSKTRLRSALEQVGQHLARTVERERQAKRLAWQSEHDEVTSLPNRVHLTKLLDGVFGDGAQDSVALAFIDFNHFKLINDSLGHAAGDDLLRQASRRMNAAVRRGDVLARFGGDEFVLLCRRTRRPNEAVDAVRRVLGALREPFLLQDQEVFLSASAGVVLGAGSATASGMLAEADAAMYRAKRSGTEVELSHPYGQSSARSMLDMRSALERAVSDGTLGVAFQPVLRRDGTGVEFFEALARWDRPGHGPVSPGLFIQVAEDYGLIERLDEQVRGMALRQLREWDDKGGSLAGSSVSVNISVRALREGFSVQVAAQLHEAGLDPDRLVLEVTESALLYGNEEALAQLRRLRAMGCLLAVDDFGAGYSSLRRLRELPASYLKLAGGLLRDVPSDGPFLAGVVALAEALNLALVVEGVEHPGQWQAVSRAGAPLMQGFHILRPSPAAVLEEWAA